MKRIPNILTLIRLMLIPAVVVLLVDPSSTSRYVALGVFLIAALTDLIDGYLARKYEAITNFGKLLDPLADKILVISTLIMLIGISSDVDGRPWVPAWMVVLIVARELWVTGLRGIAATQGIVVAAGGAGKAKSFLQVLAIAFLLLHEIKIRLFSVAITCQFIGANLLLLSIIFSIWSAIDYSILVFKRVKLEEE